MGTKEEIILAIDSKLLETGKKYMLLAEANKLLLEKEIISITEQADKSLKIALENNLISHAYQTEVAPKQWRIPLSKSGEKRKEFANKNSQREIKQNIPKVKNQISERKEIPLFTQSQKVGLVTITILIVLWIIGSFTDSSQSTTKIQNSSWDSSVYQVQNYLKRNYLNDPDSYESIEWSKVLEVNDNEYRVRHKYRAKNEFGAYMIEEKIFKLDSSGNVIDAVDVR